MSVRSVIFLLIILLLSVVSCREEKSVGPAGSSEGGKNGQVIEESDNRTSGDFDRPKRALNFGAQEEDLEKTSANKSEEPPADEQAPAEGAGDQISIENSLKDMSRTRIFFERVGDTAYYPDDMIIGQMVDELEATEEERKVLDLLNRWVDSFGMKKGDGRDVEFYSDESGEILNRRFQDLNLKIDAVRFGRMEFKDGLVRLDLRFFSGHGRTAGEIVLKLSDGGWRIQAVDIDLKALQHPYEPPEYEKNPPVYGTMQM